MIAFLRYALQADYLYAQEPAPLRAWTGGQFVALSILLVGALISWRWEPRVGSAGQLRWGISLARWSWWAALLLLLLRSMVSGPLSARVWWLSATAIGVGALAFSPVLNGLRSAIPKPVARALACRFGPDAPTLRWGRTELAWVLVHLVGLSFLTRSEGTGGVLLVLGASLLLAAFSQLYATRRLDIRVLRVELLAPMLLPYGSLFLRWAVGDWLGVDVTQYQAFPYPDPWSPLFDSRVMVSTGLVWVVLSSGAFASRIVPRFRRSAGWPAWVVLFLALTWYGLNSVRHLSHGAGGSDPYCYLQVAVDLVETASALHAFPLIEVARSASIPLWPVVHVGYHPSLEGIRAATVWPIGWPIILALFYRLGGESALLWVAPACGILAGVLTWRLARELWPHADGIERELAGGIAGLITLTSQEAALRSLVPMADAAAQLFSVLLMLCLAKARRRDSLLLCVVAGLSLAMAYFVRHPQIMLGLAAIPALGGGSEPRSRKAARLLAFGASALIGAIPDLYYHASVFGSPWATESPEWFLFSWRHMGPVLGSLLRDGWLRRSEFGYLWPLAAYGFVLHAPGRQKWRSAIMMGSGFLGVLLFSLCYSALRFRDLIPLIPWLAIWAGYGAVALWRKARGGQGDLSRRTVVIALVLLCLAARGSRTLTMPWQTRVWTFGYISAAERKALEHLEESVPPNAVIGTGLSSGAIERYAGRHTVRPGTWSVEEFARFLRTLRHADVSFYLLDDGEEMERFLARAANAVALRRIDVLGIPTYGLGGQPYGRPAVLYALDDEIP